MRLLLRTLGLAFVGLLLTIVFLEMEAYNIHYNELVNISSLSMTSTQILMEEMVEDRYYQTDNARINFISNDDYVNNFLNNLKILIKSDSEYEVEVIGVDYQKGMLDVIVRCNYISLSGLKKTITTRKTSIIDVMDEMV